MEAAIEADTTTRAVQEVAQDLPVHPGADVVAPLRVHGDLEELGPEEIAGLLERVVEHPEQRKELEERQQDEEGVEGRPGRLASPHRSERPGISLLSARPVPSAGALHDQGEPHRDDDEEDGQGVAVAVLARGEGLLVEVDGDELGELARAAVRWRGRSSPSASGTR